LVVSFKSRPLAITHVAQRHSPISISSWQCKELQVCMGPFSPPYTQQLKTRRPATAKLLMLYPSQLYRHKYNHTDGHLEGEILMESKVASTNRKERRYFTNHIHFPTTVTGSADSFSPDTPPLFFITGQKLTMKACDSAQRLRARTMLIPLIWTHRGFRSRSSQGLGK